jgi:hypothetical protein
VLYSLSARERIMAMTESQEKMLVSLLGCGPLPNVVLSKDELATCEQLVELGHVQTYEGYPGHTMFKLVPESLDLVDKLWQDINLYGKYDDDMWEEV